MQVKTFRAPTMEKALSMVKKELGPDAIILNSRKALSETGEPGFEVTAAFDQQPAPPQPTPAPAAGPVSPEIQEDLQEIKSFLSLLISSKDHFADLRMNEPLTEIYHSLLSRGIDEKQAYLLLHKAVSDLNGHADDMRQVFDTFCKRFLEKINFEKPFRSISSGSGSVFTFLGPTGVGKTTTLAKLAAYLKLKRRLDLGIISLDTYRIGAVDQLNTYANILDIPFCVVQSKAELARALQEYRHCDAVLVDTTGRNFLDAEHVSRLKSLFEGRQKFTHFLVLSATAKDEDLKQTIIHFRDMDINSLIFTKLDETIHHGCMLNQLIRFNFPVSYMGTGQRVPEDIEPATQKRILSFLLPIRNQIA